MISREAIIIAGARLAFEIWLALKRSEARRFGNTSWTHAAIRLTGSGWLRRRARWEALNARRRLRMLASRTATVEVSN
jgi:hypothetical protein